MWCSFAYLFDTYFLFKTPDVFFINEKVSFKHTVTMKNAMFRLLPDGNVIYSAQDSNFKTCSILFSYFYDSQINKSFIQCV